jgi:hypothetical protein
MNNSYLTSRYWTRTVSDVYRVGTRRPEVFKREGQNLKRRWTWIGNRASIWYIFLRNFEWISIKITVTVKERIKKMSENFCRTSFKLLASVEVRKFQTKVVHSILDPYECQRYVFMYICMYVCRHSRDQKGKVTIKIATDNFIHWENIVPHRDIRD